MHQVEEFKEFSVEVDWDFDSTIHGDDQVVVFTTSDPNYVFAFVTDGVSSCTSGRLASVLVPYYMKENIQKSAGNMRLTAEDLLLESTNVAGEKLKTVHLDLQHETACSACRWRLSKGIDACVESGKLIAHMIDDIDQLSELKDALQKKTIEVTERVIQLMKPISEQDGLTDHTSLDESARHVDDLKTLLMRCYGSSASLAKEADTFGDNINSISQVKNDIEKLIIRIEANEEPNGGAYCPRTLRKAKGFTKVAIDLLEASSTIKNAIQTGKSGTDSSVNPKRLRDQIGNLKKEVEEINDEAPHALGTFEEALNEYVNKNREKKTEVLTNTIEKIFRFDSLEDVEKMSFESTLALVSLGESTGHMKLSSVCLGDTEINMIRDLRGGFFPIYKPASARYMESFVSSVRGIEGHMDVQSRRLEGDEIIIVSSDGSNIHYTTPGGYPGAVFSRLLEEWMNKHGGSVKDFSKSWIDYLGKNNALTDDASIVILRIIRKESKA